MTDPRAISRTVHVDATPAEIFDLLADPRRHPDIDGSGSVRSVLVGPRRLSLGAKFGMRMHAGLPYATRNTVVEWDENERIAWRHVGRHVWRWELMADEDGTSVTETFDWSEALSPLALEVAGFPARNARAIEATLLRLQAHFTA